MSSQSHSASAASPTSLRTFLRKRGSEGRGLLFAALLCCCAAPAIAPAQADTLTVFGTSVTVADPGVNSLPIHAAADANLAVGLVECGANTCFFSDWIYFNSDGSRIYMASGLYPFGPPPGTTPVNCLACNEPTDGSAVDVGFWAFGIGRGFILAQSSGGNTPPGTPLPAALPLFATAIGGLGFLGWRRKRKARSAAV